MTIEDLGLFFTAISGTVISLLAMNTDWREMKTDWQETMAKTTSSSPSGYNSTYCLFVLIVGKCIIFAYLTSKYNHRRFWAPIGCVTGVQIGPLVTNRNEAATLMAANQRAEADATVTIEAVAETVVTLTTAYATLTALPADVVNLAALNGTLTAEVATLKGRVVAEGEIYQGQIATLEGRVATLTAVNATLVGDILEIRNILQNLI